MSETMMRNKIASKYSAKFASKLKSNQVYPVYKRLVEAGEITPVEDNSYGAFYVDKNEMEELHNGN